MFYIHSKYFQLKNMPTMVYIVVKFPSSEHSNYFSSSAISGRQLAGYEEFVGGIKATDHKRRYKCHDH